jgi:hypothetical protein
MNSMNLALEHGGCLKMQIPLPDKMRHSNKITQPERLS